MIKVTSLGSGSKGNSVLVSSGSGNILIDCGLTVRALGERLASIDLSLLDIDAVLVTHEHDDHIKSARALQETYDIPVYTHQQTARALAERLGMGAGKEFFDLGGFSVSAFRVTPFRTSHDAVFPLGFAVEDGESRFVYCTDTGRMTEEALAAAKGAETVFLESNHDVEMLIRGGYPRWLKQRILSDKGHLSNATCAELCAELLACGTKNIILGHLSEENNLPELAYREAQSALSAGGAKLNADFTLTVAVQHSVGKPVCCKGIK